MRQLKLGVIGGTGLADSLVLDSPGALPGTSAGALPGALPGAAPLARHTLDTPFGEPSDAIVETRISGVPVFVLKRHGPGHLLNPSHVPYRANIFALKQLGVTHIIASGAVGSLREEFRPRELVVPDQIIDKTTRRASTFFEHAAVHVEFSEPFCPLLRQILIEAGNGPSEGQGQGHGKGHGKDQNAHDRGCHDRGCYLTMEGPAFSTRAESLLHRLCGGDLIGMTAMPEAKLAREAEMAYAMVALVTDYDSWRPVDRTVQAKPATMLLEEIIANINAAARSALALIRRSIELAAQRQDALMQSPALDALRLAIWSEKSKIPREEVQRLASLWMRYFE